MADTLLPAVPEVEEYLSRTSGLASTNTPAAAHRLPTLGGGRMRRSVSTPALKDHSTFYQRSDDLSSNNLEVYVAVRGFKDFGKVLLGKLPPAVKTGLEEMGIGHYMILFKSKEGEYHQFDFGPTGGREIHVNRKGPFRGLFRGRKRTQLEKLGVAGEIREVPLATLPSRHMFVGRTSLSLEDIRSWNQLHRLEYDLHRNDCRHYVNRLVQYATGYEGASSKLLRHNIYSRRGRPNMRDRIVLWGQYMTDINNWHIVKAIGQATMAAATALTGHSLGRLTGANRLFANRLPATALPAKALVPIAKAQVVVKKPVYSAATAAVATYAANMADAGATQAPLLANIRVGEAVKAVSTSVRALAETVGRTATNIALNHRAKAAQVAIAAGAAASNRPSAPSAAPAMAQVATASPPRIVAVSVQRVAVPSSPKAVQSKKHVFALPPIFQPQRIQQQLALAVSRR